MKSLKSDYLCLLSDRDYILKVAENYVGQLREKENEVNKLNRELKDAREALDNTRVVLHETKKLIVVTNQSREQENKERHEFFQEVIKELDSIRQIYDLDSCPNKSSNKILDHFQLVDNSLFEIDSDWTFDNPLFELEEKDPTDLNDEDEIDCKTSNPGIHTSVETWPQDYNDGVISREDGRMI